MAAGRRSTPRDASSRSTSPSTATLSEGLLTVDSPLCPRERCHLQKSESCAVASGPSFNHCRCRARFEITRTCERFFLHWNTSSRQSSQRSTLIGSGRVSMACFQLLRGRSEIRRQSSMGFAYSFLIRRRRRFVSDCALRLTRTRWHGVSVESANVATLAWCD